MMSQNYELPLPENLYCCILLFLRYSLFFKNSLHQASGLWSWNPNCRLCLWFQNDLF